jgi:hypothetical protein
MREVLLHRAEKAQIGVTYELRPALAAGDPPGSLGDRTWPNGELFLERPAESCR